MSILYYDCSIKMFVFIQYYTFSIKSFKLNLVVKVVFSLVTWFILLEFGQL